MPGKVVTVIFPSPYPDNKSTFGASSDTMPSDIEVVIPGMSDHLSLHRSILRARSWGWTPLSPPSMPVQLAMQSP